MSIVTCLAAMLWWLYPATAMAQGGDTPGAMFFGSVCDVTFFETGIIVTDDLATSVTAFSLDGSVIWSLQSEGDGPRDLRAPLSTSAVGRRVYVGEPRGVKVFDLDSAHQPQYVAMVR